MQFDRYFRRKKNQCVWKSGKSLFLRLQKDAKKWVSDVSVIFGIGNFYVKRKFAKNYELQKRVASLGSLEVRLHKTKANFERLCCYCLR